MSEHDCSTCFFRRVNQTEPPCVKCLESGTAYPHWKPLIICPVADAHEAQLNRLKNAKFPGL